MRIASKILSGLLGLAVLAALSIGGLIAWRLSQDAVNPPPGALAEMLPAWLLETVPSLLPAAANAEEDHNAQFKLPPGYRITLYAADLGVVRMLRFTASGDLLASVPRRGQILLIGRDEAGRGQGGPVRTLVGGLNRPHGVELLDGHLYIAETDAILRLPFDEDTGRITGERETVLSGIPGGGNHWTRTLKLGPDGWLYFNVGSSCNVCIEEDARRATLMRVRPDGSEAQIHASGLRNTVGWDWQPGSGALYGVDNGRDLLGDDYPHCELNRIEPGGFYGWPFYNDFSHPDPDLGEHPDRPAGPPLAPALGLGYHVAPLAIHFLRPPWPPGLENAALVTMHGSWNRSTKVGYELVALHWREDGQIEQSPFLTGFREGEEVSGRPVDVLRGPDGALYVSDDHSRSVWRVSWGDDMLSGPSSGARKAAQTPVRLGVAADAATLRRGERIWRSENCAACHNPSTPVAKPLRNLAARYRVEELLALFVAPPANMPPPELPESDARALAAWLLNAD